MDQTEVKRLRNLDHIQKLKNDLEQVDNSIIATVELRGQMFSIKHIRSTDELESHVHEALAMVVRYGLRHSDSFKALLPTNQSVRTNPGLIYLVSQFDKTSEALLKLLRNRKRELIGYIRSRENKINDATMMEIKVEVRPESKVSYTMPLNENKAYHIKGFFDVISKDELSSKLINKLYVYLKSRFKHFQLSDFNTGCFVMNVQLDHEIIGNSDIVMNLESEIRGLDECFHRVVLCDHLVMTEKEKTNES